jgi:anti-sigma regulatory factor (Ser/Thr protein kinase)
VKKDMINTRRRREMSIEVAPRFTVLADVRSQFRSWLQEADITRDVVEDLVLVATELCTNAVEATPDDERVQLQAEFDGEAVRLAVSNATDDEEVVEDDLPVLPPDSLQERGRGLTIVRALVDSLAMSTRDGHTVVRAMRMV